MSVQFDIDATGSDMRLTVVIDDEVVWPHPGDDGDGTSDLDPEDVLSYLTDAWPSLLLAQSWPNVFGPDDQEPRSITGLLRAAEARWEEGSTGLENVTKETKLINEFLCHHDLSQMKFGAGLPSCFVLRQQSRMRIEANGRVFEDVNFKEFVAQLDRLGLAAVEQLRRRGGAVATRLIARWDERDGIDPVIAAALISGMPRADIDKHPDLCQILAGTGARGQISDIANDNKSPIYAAARSSGGLGPVGLAEVLRRINALDRGDPSILVPLRGRIRTVLRNVAGPREQGIRAANDIRDWLELGGDDHVDLNALSARLKIKVDRQSIPDSRLDGIAVIGPEHGPAILLNRNTCRRGVSADDLERSLRFTWGHEIGHLLLDHEEWPALIDASRQSVPRSVETRANAFATHLLLPMATAFRRWENSGSPRDWPAMDRFLNSLMERFGVPRIVASRQVMRGAPYERQDALDQLFRANIAGYEGQGH
jgi:Zn-dependent peptidase ImmA (M78 family)